MRCSEAFFNKEFFTPFQLPELSAKEFIYLLFSSSHLVVVNDIKFGMRGKYGF